MAGLRQYMPQAERDRARRLGSAYTPTMTLTESKDWVGILDLDTWQALRAKFSVDRRATGHRPVRSLLAGLVYCGHSACTKAPMGHSGRGYQCSATRGGCGRVSIAGAGLEAMVLGMVEARLEATDLGTLLAPAPMTDAERRRDELQIAYDRLLPLFEEGIVTVDELRSRRQRLDEQIKDLDRQVGQRRLQQAELANIGSTFAAWSEATVPEKATVLRTLIDRIVVRPAASGKRSGPRFDPDRVDLVWATGR